MDLRKYKYIKNNGQMPKYAQSKDSSTPNTNNSTNNTNSQNGINVGNAISSSFGFLNNAVSSLNTSDYTPDNIVNQYGQNGTGNINGVSYQKLTLPDTNTIKNSSGISTLGGALSGAASGAQAGGAFGGIGAGIGAAVGLGVGLIGGIRKQNALERALQRARENVDRTNTQNKTIADSTYLQQQYIKKNGNTSDDQLWYGKTGKTGQMQNNNGVTNQKHEVVTPVGKRKAFGNAMLAPGEVLRQNGNVQVIAPNKVKGSFKDGKDTEMALTNQESINAQNPQQVKPAPQDDAQVFGLKPAYMLGSNRTYAEHANEIGAPVLQKIQENEQKVGKYGKLSSLSNTTKQLYEQNVSSTKQQINQQLDLLADAQAKQNNMEEQMKNNNKYRTGKMPAYSGSKIPYSIVMPNDLEAGMSILDYLNHSKANINVPSTYAENPYSDYAPNQMLSLKDNPDKYLNAINDQYRYGLYDLSNAGGLTPGQRMLQRLSLNLGTQRNKASALMDWKKNNDQISMNAYNVMNQNGEASAQRQQNANALRYENLSKAYSAKQALMNSDKQNFLKSLTAKAKTTNDWNMYQSALNQYQQQNDNAKAANDIWKKIYSSGNTQPVTTTQPVQDYDYSQPYPWLTDDKLRSLIVTK